MKLSVLLLLTLIGACTPYKNPGAGPEGSLEIGVRGPDGTFRPLSEGQAIPVVLGANGLNMVVPSLRATDIDPQAPTPNVKVTLNQYEAAVILPGARVDMQNDGTGFVLWDLRVPFDVELCCYVCDLATIEATIEDASGRIFRGRVSPSLQRGECPDPDACCADASECPVELTAQTCG